MQQIAFVTDKNQPKINESDVLLARELERRGNVVVAAPWDKNCNWGKFDTIILRSCWNYHKQYFEFLHWLRVLEQLHIPIWNPIPTIRWNSHKSYLFDLQKKGVQIPPTRLIPKNQTVRLEELLPWDTAVMKPAVGASAVNVARIEKSNVKKYEKQFQNMLTQGDVIIQKYIEEIELNGEVSIIFFGNTLSHAVIKRPKYGGFLASSDFGGTEALFHPTKSLVAQAKNILDLIEEK